MAQGDTALDRAKRLQSALCKLVERRERQIEKASGEFRLDMLAAVEAVDDETLGLVQRGLAMDRDKPYLMLALRFAIDERNERNRAPHTQRSGEDDDGHEAITGHPPAYELTGDELARAMRGTPPPRFEVEGAPGALDGIDSDDAPFRYPEPGEAAVELPDGTVIAAP